MTKNIFLLATISILISCVPARKYEEVESKQKKCAEELKEIKFLANEL